MTLMDETVGRAWVAALRSGKYTQGIGALSFDGRHCCLGVLCELAADAGVVERVDNAYPNADGTVGGYKWRITEAYLLPTEVMEWAGLENHCPSVTYGGISRELAELNDGSVPETNGPMPHPEIADLIEAQYLA